MNGPLVIFGLRVRVESDHTLGSAEQPQNSIFQQHLIDWPAKEQRVKQ